MKGGTEMTIKSSKSAKMQTVLAGVLGTILSIVLLVTDGFLPITIFFSSALFIIVQVIIFLGCIAYFRTLEFSESGCVIKFLCFKKEYKWDELKTKNIEKVSHRLGCRGDSYERAVVFSKREKYHTPEILSIISCLFSIHSFFFFAVLFTPKSRTSFSIYEIEEEVFMSKMEEWGVEITHD